MRLAALGAACIASATAFTACDACATSHTATDGSVIGGSADGAEEVPFVCHDSYYSSEAPNILGMLCTVELQRECQRWGQGRTSHGYARSSCRLGNYENCTSGDDGCNDPMLSVWPVPDCACGGHSCGGGQVCISDTPGGTPYCATSCGRVIGSGPSCADACARENMCGGSMIMDCATLCSAEERLARNASCGPQYDARFSCLGAATMDQLCGGSITSTPCRPEHDSLRMCETAYCERWAGDPDCATSGF